MPKKKSEHRLAGAHLGDPQAAGELFRRYANRLIALARSRLPRKLDQQVDPEDVVHSAYRSFFAAARDGRYDRQQGGDLWQLLVTFTLRKLYRQMERLKTQKRMVDRERHFGSEDSLLGLKAMVVAREPSPVEALALAEELEEVMRRLAPPQRRILEMRLQGKALDEIAAAAGCTERTVRRVLDRVRQQLEQGHVNDLRS
jgi:RNA polymerase sigma factor (sigma-70 family)